jgi:hypothetical protein
VIVRLWRAQVPAPQRQNLSYLEDRLAPLLEQHPGFGGVLFLFRDDEATVLSLWNDRASAESFNQLPEVVALSEQVRERGLIVGEPRIEVFDVIGGHFKNV